MVSERMRARIERLLEQADTALDARDWVNVGETARAVLAIAPEDAEALGLLKMAEANLGGAQRASGPARLSPDPFPATAHPSSFVAGRYAVRRFLGEGGKKRVYLAHDERLDRDVAFALIKTEGLDEVGRERITREAQAMGRLGAHPHVVTIFEIGEEGGAPYVVTELLGGGDVEGLLGAGAIPLVRTLEIAKGVCRGLAFAHQQGVVHRDLKPGNVWLTSDGVAKIGDFGLAVSLDRSRLTSHGLMVGTVAYMPPEQALGGEVTPQADLYSLGAMLYELVTGKPPFAGDNPTAIISQHINTPPVAPSWHSEHCPPDLEALVLNLLAKVPADRPASATEVLATLERVDPEAKSASHSDSSANPLDRLARGVFVGRQRELERLRAALDDAFAGRGSVVMLVGEPGIGKTRTTQELETYARMRGAKAFWGRAQESGGAPPFWPWVQVGRAYREQTPEETRRTQWQPYAIELQRIFPRLRELFPNLPEPPPIDSEDAQFALFDAWSSFLRSVAQEQPLLVVLDDLHWADRPTLRMLSHLARDLSHARVLVVGTYRDTDLDRTHPLSTALAEMNREALFARIPLRGLSEIETATYIRDTAGITPPAELSRRVHVETEGNPFFLAEVVRLMSEEGAFAPGASSTVTIPEGVKEALGRRLDRLSPEANELLSVASVVGRECSHELLGLLTTHDDDTLLALVEEALRARVLEETTVPGEYRFTHALMQDALYSELSTARRVRMHGRVAETLEGLAGTSVDSQAAELARHFGEAAVMNRALAEKAVHYAELAGARSAAIAAWDDAVRWYREALAGLEDLPDQELRLADLWMSLSGCLRFAGGHRSEAWDAFHRGVAAYRGQGNARALATGIARNLVGGDGPIGPQDVVVLREVIEEALTALDGEPSRDACWLLALRAFSDRWEAGDEYADRARSMARLLGLTGADWPFRLDQRELFCMMDRGEYQRASEEGVRLHEVALVTVPRRPATASYPLSTAANALWAAGDVGRATALYERADAFVVERFQPLGSFIARVGLAELALAQNQRGRLEDLENRSPGLVRHALLLTSDAILAADFKRAERLLPPRDHPDVGPEDYLGSLCVEVRLRLALGEVLAASRVFAELMDAIRPERLAGLHNLIRAVTEATDGLVALGADADVGRAYAALVERPTFRLPQLCFDSADVAKGALALRLSNVDAAEGHYLEGLEWARRPEVRFGLVEGRCLQGLADVAELRGDHHLAMQYLDGAAAKFAEYGAKLYLDQVLAKKSVLGA